jgi:hypothetical protein
VETSHNRAWFNNGFDCKHFVQVEVIWESKLVYVSTLPITLLSAKTAGLTKLLIIYVSKGHSKHTGLTLLISIEGEKFNTSIDSSK